MHPIATRSRHKTVNNCASPSQRAAEDRRVFSFDATTSAVPGKPARSLRKKNNNLETSEIVHELNQVDSRATRSSKRKLPVDKEGSASIEVKKARQEHRKAPHPDELPLLNNALGPSNSTLGRSTISLEPDLKKTAVRSRSGRSKSTTSSSDVGDNSSEEQNAVDQRTSS